MSLDGVTSVVVGVETVEQMRDNLTISSKGRLDSAAMDQIDSVVPPMANSIPMPTLWGQVR